MANPSGAKHSPGPALAVGITGVYLFLALWVGGRVPFVERHMFEFTAMKGPAAVPLFRYEGELVDVHDYTDFVGLPPEAVDTQHVGYRSSVDQHFHEQRAWIAGHQASLGDLQGRGKAEVGLLILENGPDGRVQTRVRIDASGTARRRSP